MKDETITATYTFSEEGVTPALDIKGSLPTNGTITVDDSCNVDSVSISNSKYTASLENDIVKVTEGKAVTNEAYALGELVYFDPVSEEACKETTYTGLNTCYKWRVIVIDDSSANTNITLQIGRAHV